MKYDTAILLSQLFVLTSIPIDGLIGWGLWGFGCALMLYSIYRLIRYGLDEA